MVVLCHYDDLAICVEELETLLPACTKPRMCITPLGGRDSSPPPVPVLSQSLSQWRAACVRAFAVHVSVSVCVCVCQCVWVSVSVCVGGYGSVCARGARVSVCVTDESESLTVSE